MEKPSDVLNNQQTEYDPWASFSNTKAQAEFDPWVIETAVETTVAVQEPLISVTAESPRETESPWWATEQQWIQETSRTAPGTQRRESHQGRDGRMQWALEQGGTINRPIRPGRNPGVVIGIIAAVAGLFVAIGVVVAVFAANDFSTGGGNSISFEQRQQIEQTWLADQGISTSNAGNLRNYEFDEIILSIVEAFSITSTPSDLTELIGQEPRRIWIRTTSAGNSEYELTFESIENFDHQSSLRATWNADNQLTDISFSSRASVLETEFVQGLETAPIAGGMTMFEAIETVGETPRELSFRWVSDVDFTSLTPGGAIRWRDNAESPDWTEFMVTLNENGQVIRTWLW